VISAATVQSLRDVFGDRARIAEPLSRHTSFRIGGPADCWVEAVDLKEIEQLLRIVDENRLPLFILGGGTNVLVSDRGVRGVVLKLGRSFAGVEWHPNGTGTHVRAGAAVPFKKVVTEAASRSLTGLEFAEGIPGSLGGGLLMNAGAFGGEIATVIESIEGVSAGGQQQIAKAELRFGYRHFDLPAGLVISHLNLRLVRGEDRAIRARMLEYKQRRDSHQPLGLPNAGSIFKNPAGQYAGRLIEDAGLKGRRVGGAMVSPQHANFIVNAGGATAEDVRALMDEIVARVWQRSQVRLEPEIRLVGDWRQR
jgi:UDP-N-acetylmuramate dehydrogenase